MSLSPTRTPVAQSIDVDQQPARGDWWNRLGQRELVGMLTAGIIGLCWLPRSAESRSAPVPDSQTAEFAAFASEPVQRGRFVRTVPVQGEIRTHQPGILYNDCRYWPRKIVEVLPEGTQVQQGDIVCELDTAEIRTKLRDLTLRMISVRAGWQTAEAAQTLQQLKNERLLSSNDLKAELAHADWTAFSEAGAAQELRELSGDVAVRQQFAERAQETWEQTRDLSAQGLSSVAELEIRLVERQNAERAAGRATGKLNLTRSFQHRSRAAELQFNDQLTRDELQRTGQQNSLAAAVARVNSLEKQQAMTALQLQIDYLEKALAACTIRASRAGELIHSHNRDEGRYIEPGGTAHYSQEMFRIVDRSRMIVAGRVSETQVFDLSSGLPAEVQIPTLPNVELTARLDWIGSIPSPISWFAPNELYHSVQLELEGSAESLQRIAFGTTAQCRVLVEDRSDVVQVPIRAIFRMGPDVEVLIRHEGRVQRRQVRTGSTNDAQVEILDGVAEGETVLVGDQHQLRRVATTLPTTPSKPLSAAVASQI